MELFGESEPTFEQAIFPLMISIALTIGVLGAGVASLHTNHIFTLQAKGREEKTGQL